MSKGLFDKDQFIYLFQDDTRADGEYNFDEQLIDSLTNPQTNLNVNIGDLNETLSKILVEGNADHMQRAFIVCLCLFDKIPLNTFQDIICDFLFFDKWKTNNQNNNNNQQEVVFKNKNKEEKKYSVKDEGEKSGSIIFTNAFFEQLKKSRRCMMVATKIFNSFFKSYSFMHDDTFDIPYKIVCFNEQLEHQMPYKMVCPIPEEKFEYFLKNPPKLTKKDDRGNVTKIDIINVEEKYPLMVPFSIKKKKFDSNRNNSVNVRAQIHLGPNQLNEIKNLYNFVNNRRQIGLQIINADYNTGGQNTDLIYYFIQNTQCMVQSGQYLWFNTELKQNQDNARNLQVLGLLIAAYLTNKLSTKATFPLALYKKLLNRPLSYYDFYEVDSKSFNDAVNIYKDCKNYEKDESIYDFTFPVTDTFWVNLSTKPYKQLGDTDEPTLLNVDNRNEFLYRVADYFLNERIAWHFQQLSIGFQSVTLPDYVQKNFRLQEYGLLLSLPVEYESIKKSCPPGYRICPHCYQIIVKTQGCNYIKCAQCGTEFDYYSGFQDNKHNWDNPPDYRKYVLGENVSDKELNEFYEKFPHLKP